MRSAKQIDVTEAVKDDALGLVHRDPCDQREAMIPISEGSKIKVNCCSRNDVAVAAIVLTGFGLGG